MGKTGRVVLAVVAGAGVWAVLWNVGTLGAQAALPTIFAPQQPISHLGALVALIAYCAALSVLAGYTTAVVAGTYRDPATRTLAALQLGLGIVFEISFWNLTPVWYHLVFLAVIIPTTLYGGSLRAPARARAAIAVR